ncbi:MAG: (2Fe-2S)-binding protein [Chlorobiaceae bacterium]|nr:(2Fe-2S)-binding protein [Chlorobiaceae bacterium]
MNISINERNCEASTGDRLLDVARLAHSHIGYFCGGNAICQTCYVKVLEGQELLSPLSNTEKAMLSDTLIREGNRMACQTTIEKPGIIRILTMVEEAKQITLSNPLQIPAYMGKMGWEAAVKFTDTITFQSKREEEGHPIEAATLLNDVVNGIRDALQLIIDAVQSAMGINRSEAITEPVATDKGCCCTTLFPEVRKNGHNGHKKFVSNDLASLHQEKYVHCN